MLMRAGMPLAFRGADAARLGAGHQLRLYHHRARFGQARSDAGGSEAYVGGVEAGSDTADEVGHVSLAQASIGAGDAYSAALVTGCGAGLDE